MVNIFITDKTPEGSYKFLTENTSKSYVFKQLVELAQLICSCGVSEVYKPIKQGKELQKWILRNKLWVYYYFSYLWIYCVGYIDMKTTIMLDLYKIKNDLWDSINRKKRIRYPKTAIWRYSKEYSSAYATNSELPIEVVTELYKTYLREFKGFSKEV